MNRFLSFLRPCQSALLLLLGACFVAWGATVPSADPGKAVDPVLKVSSLDINNPADGATFGTADTIPIKLIAVDPLGDIRHVEFFANGQSIGRSDHLTKEAVIPGRPREHHLDWQPPTAGSYRLTAQATDTGGSQVESKPITVFVGLELPLVSIEATQYETSEPSPTIRIRPGVFTLKRTGKASEALTVSLIYEGSATPGVDFKALPQEVTFAAGATEVELLVEPSEDNVVEGMESVAATVVGPLGDRIPNYQIDPQHSAAKIIIADRTVPTIASLEMTAPRDGDTFDAGKPIVINVTAVDPNSYISRIELFDYETRIGESELFFFRAPDPGTPIFHSFEWQNAPAGEHQLTARALDSSGNRLDSKAVIIRVAATGSLPTVGIYTLDAEAMEFPPFVDAFNPARFSVWRQGDVSKDLLVVFSLHGTAAQGKDYKSLGNHVRIPAGQRDATIEIVPVSDETDEGMETVTARIEDPMSISALPEPPSPYLIQPEQGIASAVIFDRTVPEKGAVELGLPSDGETYSAGRLIPLIAQAFHPSSDLNHVDFYSGDILIGSSDIIFGKVVPGGLILHRFDWKDAKPGPHILTARAQLADGTVLFSSKAQITVVGTTPVAVLTLNLPQNGAVFAAGDSIEISASAGMPVQRLDIFADDRLLESTKFSELTIKWPNATPGSHVITARALTSTGDEVYSQPIKILVRDAEEIAFVRRELPAGYIPGNPVKVILHAEPPAGTSAYALEDVPPANWVITDISDEGAIDPNTGRVKFGLFTDGATRTLSYVATSSSGAAGAQEFKGFSSVSGKVFLIGGDSLLQPSGERHPADGAPADFAITLPELTAYAAAWKQGEAWKPGPVPIPLAYVTRAGKLWKEGEKYSYDATQGAPPLCWVNGTPPPVRTAQVLVANSATREIGVGDQSPGTVSVRLLVTSGPTVSAYGLEEKLPDGLIVTEVSDGGTYDSGTGCIRWGLFTDGVSRVLTYRVGLSNDPSIIGRIRGLVSFDGSQDAVQGTVKIDTDKAESGVRLGRIEGPGKGKIRVHLSGPPNRLCTLETSSDLRTWSERAPVFLPDGQIIYEDTPAPGETQRFYRIRSE